MLFDREYDDGHEHDWFSPLGAPLRCALCGVGKELHERRLMEDGLKWRKQKKLNVKPPEKCAECGTEMQSAKIAWCPKCCPD